MNGLTRRAFIAASLSSAASSIAAARQPSGAASTTPIHPLDDWLVVETTSGRYLVGELLVRNTRREPIELMELRISADPTSPLMTRLSAPEMLSRTATASNSVPVKSLTLAADDTVVVFLWEPLTTLAPARSVALDLRIGQSSTPAMIGGTVVALRQSVAAPARIGPPLSGGPWVGVYDPQVPRGHRRVAFPLGDRLVVPARFAIDWIKLDDQGRSTAGAATDFAQWYGFGADVLAVADAKVVAVRDSYPDVLTTERPQKRTEDDVSGNYVGLALPSGDVAFYEHLQRGSVRVKVGDTVRAGQPIARLGRSGINSAGPHLHFHVGNAPSTLDAQGRPYVLTQFRALGRYPSMTAALSGTRWSDQPRDVRGQMPESNMVVVFDPA